MKRYLPFAIIAAAGLATVIGGTLLYRAKSNSTPLVPPAEIAAAAPAAAPLHIRGDARAAVTIEEFADFQCPPCANVSVLLHKLEQDYRGRVRVIFRHYPLRNHQHARPAAYAAEAAALQGKFWEMHDLLYKNQAAWSTAADVRPLFVGYATTLGLDPNRFSADFSNPALEARVAADQERAAALGVTQTPTLFVNQEVLSPKSFSLEGIRAAIEKALAPPPVTP